MLVIQRRENQSFQIQHAGETCDVVLCRMLNGSVRLGIEGPSSFVVVREELLTQARSPECGARPAPEAERALP